MTEGRYLLEGIFMQSLKQFVMVLTSGGTTTGH